MKWLDIPPVWLIASVFAVWWIGRLLPDWNSFGWGGVLIVGWVVIAIAIIVMGMAVGRMVRARTTVIPHRRPDALVTDGVFAISRNPIYLADALVLFGAILLLDTPLSLVILPLFVQVITRRFILAEEARLADAFGPAFGDYRRSTRRWF